MRPISPPGVVGSGRKELPAYVSNGVIGLRVRETALGAGMTLLNGYTGEHPVRRIEAAAVAPYPCAGDIAVNGVWVSDVGVNTSGIEQAYDFSSAELTSRCDFHIGEVRVKVEVITFCDRAEPTLVCQEIAVEVGSACDLQLRALIDARGIEGRLLEQLRDTPGESEPACDGALLWESAGARSTCGVAYFTQLMGAAGPEPSRPPFSAGQLTSTYDFSARPGRRYRLRQVCSLVPSAMHRQPQFQAVRLAALARRRGFDSIRAANRDTWADLWKGRIRLIGAGDRWQALADAALFYLLTSAHAGSPASTSIFGLATWRDYHYYYGHVMWDIEAFITPVLGLLQPALAETLLGARLRNLASAASNARLRGRRGLQFPWESAPSTGEECAPMPASASWSEDHISLDVARAFAFHAHATGDETFLREAAWPVLSGVAKWIESRVSHSPRGYEIRESMGIAERSRPVDNPVFANMSASLVLEAAVEAAGRLGFAAGRSWRTIAEGLAIPMRGDVILSHDGYRIDEEKGATPDALMGVFPLAWPMTAAVESATLRFWLARAADYLGSPMLSALYGVWGARTGDRGLSARMMEDGYGRFSADRFMQPLEYRPDAFPDQPRAGPFFANLGGFLSSLIMGFPAFQPGPAAPETWAARPVILPRGWRAIEIGRLFVHGRPARLRARHGAARACLQWQ